MFTMEHPTELAFHGTHCGSADRSTVSEQSQRALIWKAHFSNSTHPCQNACYDTHFWDLLCLSHSQRRQRTKKPLPSVWGTFLGFWVMDFLGTWLHKPLILVTLCALWAMSGHNPVWLHSTCSHPLAQGHSLTLGFRALLTTRSPRASLVRLGPLFLLCQHMALYLKPTLVFPCEN